MDAQTSNTVIAWATAINAGVAIIYAVFTWGLWRQTRRLAELTEQQAAQTREMFEATHRPWVSIEPFQLYAFTDSQVRLEFRLHNHGSSPAFVTRWIRHWDLDSSDRGPLSADPAAETVSWCIFPNGQVTAREIKFGDPRAVWSRGNRFEVGLLYHGSDHRLRSTRLVAMLRVKGQEMLDLDDVSHEAD